MKQLQRRVEIRKCGSIRAAFVYLVRNTLQLFSTEQRITSSIFMLRGQAGKRIVAKQKSDIQACHFLKVGQNINRGGGG